MKSLVFSVIAVIAAVCSGAGHLVWAGYAIYLMVVESNSFWSAIGQCFGGWIITTVSSLVITLTSYYFAISGEQKKKKRNWY